MILKGDVKSIKSNSFLLLKISTFHCCELAIKHPQLYPAAAYLRSVVFAFLVCKRDSWRYDMLSGLVKLVDLVAWLSKISSSIICLLNGGVKFINAAVILELKVGQFWYTWLAASHLRVGIQNLVISNLRLVVKHLVNSVFPWTSLSNVFRHILKLHNETCF